MADPSSLFEQLRPLHAPASDGIVEIVVMAFIGSLSAAAMSLAFLSWRARRRPLRRASLEALAASRALPPAERLAAQALMLRRAASALTGRTACLHGEEWLACLDEIFATKLFSEGRGRAFGDNLYRPCEEVPSQALDRDLERLLARVDQ